MTYIPDAVCSLELLMMDGKTAPKCVVILNKLENCASSWFYYRNRNMSLSASNTVNVSGSGQFIQHNAAPTLTYSCRYIRLLSLYDPTAVMSDVSLQQTLAAITISQRSRSFRTHNLTNMKRHQE
jgi:hypothetical protein